MDSYYVMECMDLSGGNLRQIGTYPDLKGVPDVWIEGQRFSMPVPQPLRFELDPVPTGNMPEMFSDSDILLAQRELVVALQELGVDNLDCYESIIRDPETGKEFKDYKAVNVIGLVSAANMEKSEYLDTSPPIIDVVFGSLVIDEKKAGGRLMFRLAENLSAIIVHEKIKQGIEAKRDRFPFMVFLPPEEWAG